MDNYKHGLIKQIKNQIKNKGILTNEELDQLSEVDAKLFTRLVAFTGLIVQEIEDQVNQGHLTSDFILPIIIDIESELNH